MSTSGTEKDELAGSSISGNTKVEFPLDKVATIICSVLLIGFSYLFTQVNEIKENISTFKESNARTDERLKNTEKKLDQMNHIESDLKAIRKFIEENNSKNPGGN